VRKGDLDMLSTSWISANRVWIMTIGWHEVVMVDQLEIVIEINRIKHLCEVYQKTADASIWKAIMESVEYLCSIF
jgi:hypothetical protein